MDDGFDGWIRSSCIVFHSLRQNLANVFEEASENLRLSSSFAELSIKILIYDGI